MNAPLEELIGVLGLSGALRLVQRLPGVRVYVPSPERINPESFLARAVGADVVRQLASRWPQTEITVPRAAAYLRRERDRALHRDAGKLTVRELALKYELGEREVYRKLQEPPPAEERTGDAAESAQRELF